MTQLKPMVFAVPWEERFDVVSQYINPDGGLPKAHPDDPEYRAVSLTIKPRGITEKDGVLTIKYCEVFIMFAKPAPFALTESEAGE